MRITARRLALVVLAAAVLAGATCVALQLVYRARGAGDGLELGFATPMLYGLLSLLWPILGLDAGILAIRRRQAARAEIVLLMILGAVVLVLALVASLEPTLSTMGAPGQITVLVVSAFAWLPIGFAALVGLVVIIVQTIRGGPGRADPARAEPGPVTTPAP